MTFLCHCKIIWKPILCVVQPLPRQMRNNFAGLGTVCGQVLESRISMKSSSPEYFSHLCLKESICLRSFQTLNRYSSIHSTTRSNKVIWPGKGSHLSRVGTIRNSQVLLHDLNCKHVRFIHELCLTIQFVQINGPLES